MAKPGFNSTAKRPTVADRPTEEALQILEARLVYLESPEVPDDVKLPYRFDDTSIQNEIIKIRREIDRLRKSAADAAEAGDTYAGDFKVTQTDGQDLRVSIAVGRFVYGTGSVSIAAQTEDIASSTDTYYLYLETSYSSGLVSAITESSTYPTQSATHERVVLAEIDVADSAISDIRQIQYGEIHSSRIWD